MSFNYQQQLRNIMNRIFAVILFAIVCIPGASHAEALDQKKMDAIDELLDVTGASKMGELFGNAFVQQMTMALKQTNPQVDPRAFQILEDEIMTVIREEMINNHALNKISYPIYHKYLTLADINALIDFYNSPVGKKVISVMPQITQEAMQGGQQLAQSIGPKLEKRLNDRLKKEGIVLK